MTSGLSISSWRSSGISPAEYRAIAPAVAQLRALAPKPRREAPSVDQRLRRVERQASRLVDEFRALIPAATETAERARLASILGATDQGWSAWNWDSAGAYRGPVHRPPVPCKSLGSV